jgi:hypothetical protein
MESEATKMTEQEEFEFRNRYEREKSTPAVSPFKSGGKAAFESLGGAGGALAGGEAGAALGSFAGPIGTVVGGLGGALAGGYLGSKAQEKAGQYVPQQVKEATGFTPEQRAAERKEAPTATTIGEIAPDVAAAGPTLARLGKYGYTKASDLVSSFKKPQPFAAEEGLDVVGEKGFKLLKDKFDDLYQARKKEAETKYDDAFKAARDAQAQGNPFASSTQGRALIQDLESQKKIISGGKPFLAGEEQIKGLDRLINALKGITTGGEKVPVGKGVVSSKLTKETPKTTTEKDIKAVVEELRFLRDVDAKGKPYEAYAALDANYKRDLIKRLENALYQWNPEYKAADEAYRAASQKLEPFKTRLMEGALKGEKFDPKSLVASAEQFGPKFFSDVNGVRQLKEVTQDPSSVAQLGKEYVASILSNKTPQQVKAFATDSKNSGWMREAGIYDDVVNYANKAATAESRSEILKKIGYGAAGAGIVSAVGSPLYYGVRRALGL